MTKDYLLKLVSDFSETSPYNYLSPPADSKESLEIQKKRFNENNYSKNIYYEDAGDGSGLNVGKEERYYGMRFFLPPVMAVGSAQDEGFQKLKEPEVVGPHHMMPEDWLPGAKTVISFFLPYAHHVIESNRIDPVEPSMEWLYTRVEGQQMLLATGALIRDALIAEGYRAVTPYTDDRFVMKVSPAETAKPIPAFSSNWSERHVGFITGLGTFGKSTNFISKAGTCGRLISVVTDWEIEPDEKDYTGLYDYCSECGACYRACPAGALSSEGKDIVRCSQFLRRIGEKYKPRYGCGKCQSGVPCAVKPQKK